MKNFLSLFAVAAIALVFVTTGCKEDETPTIDLPADVVFLTESPVDGTLYFDVDFETTDVDAIVPIGISASIGTSNIKSLKISEDGAAVDVARFTITDLATSTDITPNNPLLILGDNVDGFQFEILLDVQDTYGPVTYTFDVTDENDLVGTSTITITTVEPATPLDMTLEGVLFNSAGPAGKGSIDLSDGTSYGSMAGEAQLRDLGIDCAEPNAANWLAQFGSVNGADMVMVDVASIEDFSFATVDSKEIILEAYSKGIELADGSTVNTSGCDAVPLSVTDVAAPVDGDVFVVEAGGVYYMVEVASVNTTTADNDDSYTLNIKY